MEALCLSSSRILLSGWPEQQRHSEILVFEVSVDDRKAVEVSA